MLRARLPRHAHWRVRRRPALERTWPRCDTNDQHYRPWCEEEFLPARL